MSKRTARVAAGVALAVLSLPSTASAEAPGLWPSTFQANVTDCGDPPRVSDSSHFCFIDDPGSVELGVKFTSSKSVDIVGVRAYRTDTGSVTGSLWMLDGARLATRAFASYAGIHGWQDAPFVDQVSIEPGQTYVASYYAPSAEYAFEHRYFTNSAYTAGPITALQSVTGDGNGVFCYDVTSCFPDETFRDSNYWVTPLWNYRFSGFNQPIDNGGVWNTVKAGSAIPVRFSLAGDQGLDVIKAGFPTATATACPLASAPLDAIEETAAAGQSVLSYDATIGQYVYVWKTDKKSAGKCYRFELGLKDDTSHTFNVELLK